MFYKPGDSYYKEFTTSDPTSGAARNADSTPVATANHNGIDDSTFVLTVTNIDTGRYKITGTVPAGYAAGDVVNTSIAATVNSVAGKIAIDTFMVDTKRVSNLNDIASSSIVSGGAIATSSGAVSNVTTVTNSVTSNVTQWAGSTVSGTPPTTSAIASATASAILATPANLLATDSSGRVILQPTQTGVTIPTVTTVTNTVPANVIEWNSSTLPTFASTISANVTQWAGSTVSGTPPTTSAIASATASAILATPANLLVTDSSGRVVLQPTQTGVTIPTVTTVTNAVTSNVTQWAGSTVSGTPPTTSAIASATAAEILATPANLLATDSSGRVILQPTQTGVTIPTVTTVTNAVTAGTVSDKSGYSLATAPPTTSAIASATAAEILATPANLLATDSSGRVILQPTQTGVTIPNVTTVTNAVTAGTVSDKSGYSLATAPPTASAIASATAAEILATPANLLATDSSGRVQVQYGTAAGQVNLSGGNLAGAVPSVTGSIGGSVGSVTGTVGSVTGSVGSVAGNVGGNVLGSVNSVSYPVTIATGSISSSTFAAITAGTTGFLERLALLIHRFYPSGSGKIIQPTTVAPSGSECITYGPDGMTIIASQDISDDGTTQMIGYTQ